MKCKIKIFDPYFINKDFDAIKIEENLEDAVNNSDVLILGTDHDEFLNMNYAQIKNQMRTPGIIIDTRGKLVQTDITNVGLVFRGIGRGTK